MRIYSKDITISDLFRLPEGDTYNLLIVEGSYPLLARPISPSKLELQLIEEDTLYSAIYCADDESFHFIDRPSEESLGRYSLDTNILDVYRCLKEGEKIALKTINNEEVVEALLESYISLKVELLNYNIWSSGVLDGREVVIELYDYKFRVNANNGILYVEAEKVENSAYKYNVIIERNNVYIQSGHHRMLMCIIHNHEIDLTWLMTLLSTSLNMHTTFNSTGEDTQFFSLNINELYNNNKIVNGMQYKYHECDYCNLNLECVLVLGNRYPRIYIHEKDNMFDAYAFDVVDLGSGIKGYGIIDTPSKVAYAPLQSICGELYDNYREDLIICRDIELPTEVRKRFKI